jgi:hypothetical protein
MITCDTTLGQPLARPARSPIELSSRRPDRGSGNRGRPRETAAGQGSRTVGRPVDRPRTRQLARVLRGRVRPPAQRLSMTRQRNHQDPVGRCTSARVRRLRLRDGEVGRASSRMRGTRRFAGGGARATQTRGPSISYVEGPRPASTACLSDAYPAARDLMRRVAGPSWWPDRPTGPQERNSAAFCCSAAAYCWPA